MQDRDYMIISSWDWTDETAVQSVVDQLNGALSKYAEPVASTAKCNVKFYKASAVFTSEAYYIYMVEGNSPTNPKILKIMPNADVATPGCRICAYFNDGTFVMHSAMGNVESDVSGNSGLYVVYGKKGFSISAGTVVAQPFHNSSYEWPLFVTNGVYDDIFITGRRQSGVNYTAYICALNPRYPESNPTTSNIITKAIRSDEPVRGGMNGLVASEQMIPMQVPSPAGSEMLTDVCLPGIVTNIHDAFVGDVSITNSATGETARFFSICGWLAMRLND